MIAGISQPIGIGIREESDENRVVVGGAEGIRHITIKRIVQMVVKGAGFVGVGIPHVGSADEGEEVRVPERIVEATGLSVEDECVRVRIGKLRNQIDVAAGFNGPNRIFERVGVQISGQ